MKSLSIVSLFFITINSFAQSNCPKRVASVEQSYAGAGLTIKSPQVAWLRSALLVIDGMIKTNTAFSDIPEARLRNTMYASGGTAQLNAKAYSKRGWDNKCGIIPQADRIGADNAGISFNINKTGVGYTATEYCPIKDEKLEAFYVPKQTGTIGGYPYYYLNEGSNFILLTYNKKDPWVPVSLNEYLDFVERGINKRIDEHNKDKANAPSVKLNDAEIRKMYESFKKTNPQMAEEYLKMMENLKKEQADINSKTAKEYANADVGLQKELADFKAFRASLSSQELEKQVITGGGKYGLYSDEYPHAKKPLVKISPDFIVSPNTKRIKLISIYSASTEPRWENHVKEAVKTLDYTALEGLLMK